jgi:hypothetical protein
MVSIRVDADTLVYRAESAIRGYLSTHPLPLLNMPPAATIMPRCGN